MQYQTKLYLVDIGRLSMELFYQQVVVWIDRGDRGVSSRRNPKP